MGFASVDALVAFGDSFVQDLLRGAITSKKTRQTMETWLGVKLEVQKVYFKKSSYKKKSETRRKERSMKNGMIVPQWNEFAHPNDMSRTPEQHEAIITRKVAMNGENLDSPGSTEIQDEIGLIALHNIIATLRPDHKRVEIDIDPDFFKNKNKPSHRRKLDSRHIQFNSARKT